MSSVAISPEIIFEAARIARARGRDKTSLAFIIENAGYDDDLCLIWPFSRFPSGYGKLGVGGKVMFAHRVMCALVNGAPPTPSHEAAHSCGKGHDGCINPAHLRWATRKENIADKRVHGTMVSGCANYNAKLTPTQVNRIRKADFSQWGSKARMARELNVPPAVVIRASTGKGYRNV